MKGWFLFILLPFWLNAQIVWQAELPKPFKLTVKIDPQSLTLGDTLQLEMKFEHPSSYQLDKDALIDQLTWSANPLAPQWEIVNTDSSMHKETDGTQQGQLHLTLTPLVSGQLELSFLAMQFVSDQPDKSPVKVPSPFFSVDVLASAPLIAAKSAPFLPLEPQYPLELTPANRKLMIDNPQALEKAKEALHRDLEARSFPWMTLAILLVCGGIGWIIYLMRDRLPRYAAKPALVLSPQENIERALQALQNDAYIPEQAPLYYAKLSSLLNAAIQMRSGVNAQQLTTVELAHIMKQTPALSGDQGEKALSLLSEIDQVKFAGKQPAASEAKIISQHTQQCVREWMNESKG